MDQPPQPRPSWLHVLLFGVLYAISVGGAVLRATLDGSANRLLEQADAALYRAKEQGRNTVAWASA
ncbi:diguanylate cyclase [Curvibacter sp. CHRR-16]|uniref:diguanylate cyclase domain-containing protein n=1 Tax=Curvibacter sp. CHRR-16 TaxID=2835872 RepID=UPI0032E9FE52